MIPTDAGTFTDYTMSLWLSPDEIPGESFFIGQTNQGIHHGLRDAGKLHQAHWGNDHSGATTVPTGDASDAASWVHATYTYDDTAGIGTIYYNGVVDDGGAVAKGAPNQRGADNFLILGGRNNGQAPFNGQVDDVAMWTSILPAGDIAALAAGTSSPTDLGATVYYPFSEGSGNLTVNAGAAAGSFVITIPDPPPPAEEAMATAMTSLSTRQRRVRSTSQKAFTRLLSVAMTVVRSKSKRPTEARFRLIRSSTRTATMLLMTQVDDTAFFDGNRGHSWTGGVLTVGPGGMDLNIDASMHERGGGDSFEVAVAAGDQGGFTGNGFYKTLAGQGEHGISVVPEPGANLLAAMGLFALLGLRRRK